MEKMMLNLKYKISTTLAILFICSIGGFAQTINESIVSTTKLEPSVIINVENHNYEIDYKTTDSKELKVKYEIQAEAKSDSELKSFYNALKDELESQLKNIKSGNVYIVHPFKSMFNNGKRVKIVFKGSGQKYLLTKLDMKLEIQAPRENMLKLKSSFSKVSVDDIDADANIKVSSAKFQMGNCKNLILRTSFCTNMQVGNVTSADIELNSSDLEMGDVETDLELKSSFSKINIKKIGNKARLKLNSSKFQTSDIKDLELDGSFIREFKVNNISKVKLNLNSSEFEANNIGNLKVGKTSFSTFRISHVEDLEIGNSSSSKFIINALNDLRAGDCSFTDFIIKDLKKSFDIKSNSGKVKIENVLKDFDQININGQFVTINIGVEEDYGFNIEANLIFPQYKLENVNIKEVKTDLNYEYLYGWKGANKAKKSIMRFECKSCNITVK